MAAHPVLVVDDEILGKLPEQFKADPRYQKGAALELVPLQATYTTDSANDAIRKWESLQGLLADSEYDPNAELEREKQAELAKEVRWLEG